MDSADGHRMGPEPGAEAEQPATERPQVWLVWAERGWLVGRPAPQGSMAQL